MKKRNLSKDDLEDVSIYEDLFQNLNKHSTYIHANPVISANGFFPLASPHAKSMAYDFYFFSILSGLVRLYDPFIAVIWLKITIITQYIT
jgi:hypothetical protein